MEVDISVFDPNEDQVTSFSDYRFMHVGCGSMTNTSLILLDDIFLRCTCGLEIHLLHTGGAEMAITKTAIDQQARYLERDSFHSNLATAVRVNARGAA